VLGISMFWDRFVCLILQTDWLMTQCAISQKSLFGTVLRVFISASVMWFYVICNMRLSHELGGFSSQLPARVFPRRLTLI
jgi:hypothetical protein